MIARLDDLATGVKKYRLIPGAARGLGNLQEQVRLQTRALRWLEQPFATGRSTRTIAGQTLTQAANLDSKVGAVP